MASANFLLPLLTVHLPTHKTDFTPHQGSVLTRENPCAILLCIDFCWLLHCHRRPLHVVFPTDVPPPWPLLLSGITETTSDVFYLRKTLQNVPWLSRPPRPPRRPLRRSIVARNLPRRVPPLHASRRAANHRVGKNKIVRIVVVDSVVEIGSLVDLRFRSTIQACAKKNARRWRMWTTGAENKGNTCVCF